MKCSNIDINKLKVLIDFPNYRIDTKIGRVFRFARHGFSKEPKLWELKGKPNGRRKESSQPVFALTDKDGKRFYASLGRLVISATHNVSYFKIPKELSICFHPERGLSVRSRSEAATLAWESKLKDANLERIRNIDMRIEELSLIKQAFLGIGHPCFLMFTASERT